MALLERLFSISIVVSITSWIVKEVNKIQPKPYMDEIFHIPQAQNYCHGHFHHWNNKITTLPGLYLFSQLLFLPTKILASQSVEKQCTSLFLRLTNVLFYIGIIVVLKKLLCLINLTMLEKRTGKANQVKILLKDNGENKNIEVNYYNVQSVVLSLFPLLYFFCFFYYTDVGSTLFVLLSYYFALQKYHYTSAFTGFLSILFRQTNVVWVVFNASVSIFCFLKNKSIFKNTNNLLEDIALFIRNLFVYFTPVFKIGFPYGMVLLGFLFFVFQNDGIVVGDRSSHEASFNVPQLMYFALFTGCFSFFITTRYLNFIEMKKICLKLLRKWMILFCLFTLICMVIAINKLTYTHKYTLADNRHYTFYIWRRVIDRSWYMRYALIPFYFCSIILILNELGKTMHHFWIFLFVICTCMVLIPQKLFEFRYFIVPYILFRLHIRPSNKMELFIEAVVYSVINALTLYLFLYRPFQWEHEEGTQRFMW